MKATEEEEKNERQQSLEGQGRESFGSFLRYISNAAASAAYSLGKVKNSGVLVLF